MCHIRATFPACVVINNVKGDRTIKMLIFFFWMNQCFTFKTHTRTGCCLSTGINPTRRRARPRARVFLPSHLPTASQPHHGSACARVSVCEAVGNSEREREWERLWSIARHGREARSRTRELRARVWIPAWAGKELRKQPRTILLETKDNVGGGGTEVEPSSVALPPSYFYFSSRG